VRLKVNDLDIYESESHFIVALSRTEEDFTYCTVDPYDKLFNWLRRVELQDFTPPVLEVFAQRNYIHLGGAFTIREDTFFQIRIRRLVNLRNIGC
jgi:hypothetical protein